jgi:hypothetical protein
MLADLAFAQQRYAEAATDYRFLLETRAAVLHDDNPQTGVILNNLGNPGAFRAAPTKPSRATAAPSPSSAGLPVG